MSLFHGSDLVLAFLELIAKAHLALRACLLVVEYGVFQVVIPDAVVLGFFLVVEFGVNRGIIVVNLQPGIVHAIFYGYPLGLLETLQRLDIVLFPIVHVGHAQVGHVAHARVGEIVIEQHDDFSVLGNRQLVLPLILRRERVVEQARAVTVRPLGRARQLLNKLPLPGNNARPVDVEGHY